MGVNAAGTLGGSQIERRRRENRGAVGGEGWGLMRGCAPSQKIYEFFISKWCDMVHSGCVVFKIHVQLLNYKLYTGRIADENDSDLRYSEVLLKGKIKHLSKYWGVATTATPAALTPMDCV